MKKYDYLIVGSGLYGSTFARVMSDYGYKCLIIEARNHLGGNVYSERVDGIDVHKYGPHIFHTNDDRIWRFMQRFTTFNNFFCRTKVNYKGRIFSFPINLLTLHQLYGVTTPSEAEALLVQKRIDIPEPKNLEEWALSQVGPEIYETFIKGYTTKQWQRDPKDLPSFIIKRLPIRLNLDDNYFFDKYQGIPENGYTEMVEKMLAGIQIELNTNYFENRQYFDELSTKVVFTGKIDEFFNYRYGALEYRTLRFESESFDGDFQGNAVVNYTDEEVPFTRIVEHKHFKPDFKMKNSIITREYPDVWDKDKIPYYPINNDSNMQIYSKYKELADNCEDVIFGGRLAEYRYYDMHQVVASALVNAKKILMEKGHSIDFF